MKNFTENHEGGWGEHDFIFETDVDAARAAEALYEAGYMVGGDAPRVTIAIDAIGRKTDIKLAREIIWSL